MGSELGTDLTGTNYEPVLVVLRVEYFLTGSVLRSTCLRDRRQGKTSYRTYPTSKRAAMNDALSPDEGQMTTFPTKTKTNHGAASSHKIDCAVIERSLVRIDETTSSTFF
jgi:hypothetical protein